MSWRNFLARTNTTAAPTAGQKTCVQLRGLSQGVLAVLLIVLVTITPGGTADAASRLAKACPPDYGYSFSGARSRTVDMVLPSSGGPGIPLTIALTAGLSVSGTVGGQVSGDVNLIVAGAQAQVNASLTTSLTAQVTYTGGPWTVPRNVHIGYLHAGADKESMVWKYGHYAPTCAYVLNRTGSLDEPWHLPHFWATTA